MGFASVRLGAGQRLSRRRLWARAAGILAAHALLAGILGCSTPPEGTPIPPRTPFANKIWSDEFEGAAGSSLDKDRWHHEKGPWPFNKELQIYTDAPDNIALDGNGNLVITARKDEAGVITSARIDTRSSFTAKYGRFEARMKLPKGQGMWPAFWLLGDNYVADGWPSCGEIDIMEEAGDQPAKITSALHGPGYSGGNPIIKAYRKTAGPSFADDFHVFAVEWEPQVIRFVVDDIVFQTVSIDDVTQRGRWVYDHPFYIILNLAVGGAYPGDPDETTTYPQSLTVDYVRVWQH